MPLTRRAFTTALSASVLRSAQRRPPNILWLTCEDTGPHLGCYGDRYAGTPNLDRFAARSLRYRTAWSTAPVCAPARTAIISGLYPSSTGAEHMRSITRLPARMQMYPQFLRNAGYYATNNSKEDYNLEKPGQVWDDSSNKAHWRNRKSGQPFFAIFNFTVTHESQIRRRPHTLVHDPAKVRIPAYHPDTPEVRHDWAQYYDNITTMDQQAAAVLRQLEDDGLADSTIIFFYGDHGSGMPRSKRWPYNSGLQVPMIVHVPDALRHLAPPDYKAGGTTTRLVSFVDLAPTVLSLAGIKPPGWMQGHAFLGEHQTPAPSYLHGLRGRMDERYDMVRSVRDQRYIYVRNYMPHLPYGQYLDYMFQTPTTRVWKELYDQGKLKPPQTYFWETKPPEELYDLDNDPDEVNNLAGLPDYSNILERFRKVQRGHALKIRDAGFLPEDEIHARSKDSSPYEVAQDPERYPLERILNTAGLASSLKPEAAPTLAQSLNDPDSAVRYWAALGLLMRGEKEPLRKSLKDPSPTVRVIAARALADIPALLDLAGLDKHGVYVAILALNALDQLGAKPTTPLPTEHPSTPARMQSYIPRLLK